MIVIVHGGAAKVPANYIDGKMSALKQAVRAGYAVLSAGESAMDAVEAAVRVMEDDPHFNCGNYWLNFSVNLRKLYDYFRLWLIPDHWRHCRVRCHSNGRPDTELRCDSVRQENQKPGFVGQSRDGEDRPLPTRGYRRWTVRQRVGLWIGFKRESRSRMGSGMASLSPQLIW